MRSTGLLVATLSIALAATACGTDLPEIPESFDPSAPVTQCRGKCDGDTGPTPLASLPNATLATRFAPYETPLAYDLTLIREVVDARVEDSTPYPEGSNPFRIRYAVYNLRNQAIAGALADAADAGVDVQILIEKDQLDPARDWNTTDELLVERGFELVGDHRDLDATTRETADLIGISGSGLMHLKTRIYEWIDGNGDPQRRVVTGSMNPGDLAEHNDETLHYIDDAPVTDAFVAKYEAVLDDRTTTNHWDATRAVNVLFSPDPGPQARDRIAELIDAEDELILLAMYSLRDIAPQGGGAGIVDRLVAAHERGVKVVVVTDRKQSDGIDADGNPVYWNDGSEEPLRDAGIPVYEVINHYSPFNAMHAKYAVFGLTEPVIVTGAGNWTRAGLGSGSSRPRNDESLLFINTAALDGGITAMRYLGNFLEILHRYEADDAGGPPVSPLIETLAGLEAWPSVDVHFRATAQTRWGQNVYVTGGIDALGDWTRAHPGWPLATDGASYPEWTGAPLALPFGTRAEYKLIKYDGVVEWESGDNRWLVADPTDARVERGDGAVTPTAVWR